LPTVIDGDRYRARWNWLATVDGINQPSKRHDTVAVRQQIVELTLEGGRGDEILGIRRCQ